MPVTFALKLPHFTSTLGLLGVDWLDPETLLAAGGWAALIIACLFVFLETGVVVLAFLPGDSLLFTVGLFSATGPHGAPIIDIPVGITCATLFVCAFLGDQLGFILGRHIGPTIFRRPKSRLFNPENVTRTHAFFKKHGPKTIIIARFLPVIRGFVPAAAGVGNMGYRRFVAYNAVGALLWAVGVTLLGYYLGQIPFVQRYSEIFIIVLVLIPGIPILLEMRRAFHAWQAKRKKTTNTSHTQHS